ncbi:hypothetical protein QBC44DRAFT_386584 [Cladorrhinum sp. PSN332]|nr:hypothetical protein QBC44DRAFT_386584 [Cladorrhinum sp. PSN332]
MASTDSGGRAFRSVAKTKQQPHQFSCDRCRGQKLKCQRKGPLEDCERCQKAGARCLTDQSVRMGRPPKRRERRETTASSGSTSQQSTATMEWASQTCSSSPSKTLMTNDTMWFGYLDDAALDATLHVQHDGTQDLLDLHSTSASASDDWFDGAEFDDPASPRAPTCTGTQPSPFISIEAANITTAADPEKRSTQNTSGVNTPSTMIPQELIERMSSLNLGLHHQSAVASQLASDYNNCPDPSMIDPHKDTRLSFAVDSMVQGLQNLHSLLLEIMGSANNNQGNFSNPTHEAAIKTQQQQQQQQQNRNDNHGNYNNCFFAPNISGFWFGGGGGAGRKDSDSTATPQEPDSVVPANSIDLPTGLLIVSCHVNLIHLCRHVFAGIRSALSSRGHQRALPALSSCQIGGVSILQDSDLQLVILIQVVARLINKIGVLLGYPATTGTGGGGDESAGGFGGGGGGEEESPGGGNRTATATVLTQLLRFVLTRDGVAGQPSYGGGMEALREEITRLNEMLAVSS